MEEFDVGAMAAHLIAVLALECRASHHPTIVVINQPLPDGLQPRIPVVVVERR